MQRERADDHNPEEAILKSVNDTLSESHRKKDAISLLTADHEALLALFDEVQKLAHDAASRPRCAELVSRITALLKLHLEVENTIFYPAATVTMRDESVAIESSFEQDDEQYVIEQLDALSIDDPRYGVAVASLSEQLREHVLEEETEIFPRLKASRIDMDALGIKIRRRQRGLA
jgi:hemerythrin-like domain-containing protein